MGSRGRKSAASLSVISDNGIETIRRPDVPEDLTAEQGEQWLIVVNRLPADWFAPETFPMLSQYCRHVVAARRVAELISRAEADPEFDLDDYDKLLKMQEREGRALSSLATRMRITQQATYDKSKKKPSNAKNPWEG